MQCCDRICYDNHRTPCAGYDKLKSSTSSLRQCSGLRVRSFGLPPHACSCRLLLHILLAETLTRRRRRGHCGGCGKDAAEQLRPQHARSWSVHLACRLHLYVGLRNRALVRAFRRRRRELKYSHHDNAANAGAFVHVVEGFVDVGQRHLKRHHVVDIDLAVHVLLDVAGQFGAAFDAAKC